MELSEVRLNPVQAEKLEFVYDISDRIQCSTSAHPCHSCIPSQLQSCIPDRVHPSISHGAHPGTTHGAHPGNLEYVTMTMKVKQAGCWTDEECRQGPPDAG